MATCQELINECELWEYSKEAYDLMKECSEVQLMGMYIRNQEFLMEAAPVFESAGMKISEGYFAEAASEAQMTAVTEAFGAKKTGIFQKIKDILSKLLGKLIAFLKGIQTKLKQRANEEKVMKFFGGKINRETARGIIEAGKKAGIVLGAAGAAVGITAGVKTGFFRNMLNNAKKFIKNAEGITPDERDQLAQLTQLVVDVGSTDAAIILPEEVTLPSPGNGISGLQVALKALTDLEYDIQNGKITKIPELKPVKVYMSTHSSKNREELIADLDNILTNLINMKPEEAGKEGEAANVSEAIAFASTVVANVMKAEAEFIKQSNAAWALINNIVTRMNPTEEKSEKAPKAEEPKKEEPAKEENK